MKNPSPTLEQKNQVTETLEDEEAEVEEGDNFFNPIEYPVKKRSLSNADAYQQFEHEE